MTVNFVDSSKTVLIIGATSGIGRAIAERFAKAGKETIVTGRRDEKLKEVASQSNKIETRQWDLAKLDKIKSEVDSIFSEHGDINAVYVVSGLQRTTDFTEPGNIDFSNVETEITTNYTAYVYLVAALLPHLEKAKDAILGLVSSQLAIVPNDRTPVYNGTKAALHMFVMSLRLQLKAKSAVKLVEIYPPSVATELHAKHNQPDLPDDYKEMPLDEFIDGLWHGLEQGKLDIPVGGAVEPFEKVELERYKLASL